MRLRDIALRILGGKPEEQRAISVPWDVGGPIRGASVSADQALSLIPVFAAVRLLASQVASLPLQTYRKTGDGRMKIPPPSLFVNPSVQGSLYDWLHRAVTSLALRGNAFGLITQRDRDQYPTMIEWLHPDDVFVDDRMASGPGSFANPIWYWQGRIIPAEDLVHIPWFTVPGRVLGLSPIGACAVTVSTGLSAQAYTSDWFDNGAVPPGEFKNTEKKVDQTEADIISARLNNAIRRRKPLVYGSDWEYKPISVSAHEAKFVETLKMNATQIAAVYGIPPEMIGGEAGGPLTYNTVEQNSLNFLKFTLRPWLELLEAAFFKLTPRPQYVKFNIDALLRSDLTTRMTAYKTAREIGLNNIDELRALEDESPLPGGQGQSYAPLATPAGGPALRYADAFDAEVVAERGVGNEQAQPKLGVALALELEARRADPSHPAAFRTFDPTEPREPHSGKWTSGPGGAAVHAAEDALKLAGRIDLGKDEHLVASGRFEGHGGSSVSLLHAVVDTPRGREFRLGVIPDEDVGRWRAGDKGSTVKLSPRQLGHLRDDLTTAQKKAKAEAKRIDAIWNSGGHPTEAELTTPVAEGSVAGTWGELTYLIHLTDDDPTSYQTTLDVAHNGVPPEASDGVQLTPADLGKLIKQLDGLTAG